MGSGSSKILSENPSNVKKNSDYLKSIHPYPKKSGGSSKGKKSFEDFDKGKTFFNRPSLKYRTKLDPRVVAKYDVKALVGRGNFSKVFRVERKNSKQPFAIKMVDVKDKGGREACNAELRVLGRVKHQFIVQLMEVFEASDKIYMVMELASGGELYERIISRGTFSEKDAVKIIQMILQAVDYLHLLGITHRDLKLENLLYSHKGNDSKILITDFGLASWRSSGSDVTMTTFCGTPEYIAPEVLARKPYTSAVDNWAIGVITYIVLSGMMPFDNESRTKLFGLIMSGNYQFSGNPWPKISQTAKDFISGFLTVDPEQRMSPRHALQHPWLVNHSSQSCTNLQRCISDNFFKRVSSRNTNESSESDHSIRSLRSQHRTLKAKELDDLLKKYDVL